MNYLQFNIKTNKEIDSDTLVALLAQHNFEGFEETDDLLKAFIAEEQFDSEVFAGIKGLFPSLEYEKSVVKQINWNAEWEANFKPVIIDNSVGIRADFHEPLLGLTYEIVITPKMSFGTGHHSTTSIMVQLMMGLDFIGKSVFDFGTGTGILAILAHKKGAAEVIAMDNDEWSIENARENIIKNNTENIILVKGDSPPAGDFEIIIANINLNIIVNSLKQLEKSLKSGGIILLSGFLPADLPTIQKELDENNLTFLDSVEHNNWLAVKAGKHQ